jgi:hypothetical protein
VCAATQASGKRIVESLGGKVSAHQKDTSVTHMVAEEASLVRSLKLLLAVARGVPVVSVRTWLDACK